MVAELELECKDANRLLSELREFIKKFDALLDRIAFSKAKTLREEIGQFLDSMNYIGIIDNEFLLRVGFPKYTDTIKDIGPTNMELLLLYIKNFCEGRRLSLEDALKLIQT